jgi:hypothetical protein
LIFQFSENGKGLVISQKWLISTLLVRGG